MTNGRYPLLGRAPAAHPLRLGQPPVPGLPIWVAALGHHTIPVAAELGDGWIPALVARDRLPAWAAQLSCPAGTRSVYRWCHGPREFVLTWLLCRIASDRLASANHSVLYMTITIFGRSGKGRAV